MSALDRDKAREVLRPYIVTDEVAANNALDRLEECVQPPLPFVVHSEEEFRGRISAEAKLTRIAALRDKAELGKGSPWFMEQVSAVLDGGAA